jgi:hypothetical protein
MEYAGGGRKPGYFQGIGLRESIRVVSFNVNIVNFVVAANARIALFYVE